MAPKHQTRGASGASSSEPCTPETTTLVHGLLQWAATRDAQPQHQHAAAEIAADLHKSLRLKARIDTDTNYRQAPVLWFCFDERGQPTSNADALASAASAVRVWTTPKGPFFALDAARREGNGWVIRASTDDTRASKDLDTALRRRGLVRIPSWCWELPIEGCPPDLGGRATVWTTLFGEI